jgi:glycosyltransferase involved in cell wall biosynthesis
MLWAQAQLWAGRQHGAVLYVRGHYMAFPSTLIAKLFNIPIFHEINGPYEDVFIAHPVLNKLRWILIPMQRIQYRWATGLIAVTQELVDWAKTESGHSRCRLISNGANIDIFKPLEGKSPTRSYAIFFGGLTEWHGVPVMLEAVQSDLWPKNIDLVIIGDGIYASAVRDLALKNKSVHFKGRLPYREVASWVCGALVGLVPISNPGGRSETGLMPLKLFETLACGVPVIVTDFPGQADCGLVIPDQHPEELAKAVAMLADDRDRAEAMGARGAAEVRSRHSWRARARETFDFIEYTLNAHKT